jgi:transglutaminase-like putative cysteine protease
MIFIVRPCAYDRHHLHEELRLITPALPIEDYSDPFGNRAWRFVAPVGTLRIHYDALADLPATPDLSFPGLPQTPVEQLPYDLSMYTLPSRYCESDLFANDAWALFGAIPAGWDRVEAICAWVAANITYGSGSTTQTSGQQAYHARRGVCRDFAHIAISFCRALNIPARYVSGYLPDTNANPTSTPMDFHAWFEAYLSGAWYTFDARYLTPQVGRVVIGRGRDAADVALTTSYGNSQLHSLSVWAAEVADTAALARPDRTVYAGVTQLGDDLAPDHNHQEIHNPEQIQIRE